MRIIVNSIIIRHGYPSAVHYFGYNHIIVLIIKDF